jgi:hypothetical protein
MLDRASVRALAEAGYMPVSEYLRDFTEISAPSKPTAAQRGFDEEAYSVRMSTHWPQQTTYRAQLFKKTREAA